MKKYLLTALFICVFVSSSHAGFDFGTTTYEQVDNILIVNSLGDTTTESKFIHNGLNLGYNDYIPENAFKNDLYNQGYTKVLDYNDTSLNLVEVGYMGVKGNPRSYDADYVLREEYEKYSSQYQDVRIDKNKTKINNVDKKHTVWNKKQDVKIDNNSDNIANNSSNIVSNTNNIKSNTDKINNVNNRVNELEKTQYIVEANVRIVDSKKWNVELFADYSTARSMIDRTGIKFTYKMGTSYLENRINELEKKLTDLDK